MSPAVAIPKWISDVRNRRVRRAWKSWWLRPWTVPLDPDRAVACRRRLRQHGRYSTHITIAEWKSHPDQCRCPVTASPYPRRTQKLAFKVERVRHRLGDVPIRVISAYRNRCHERCIGGALAYHLRGQAVDPVKPSGMSTTTWNAPWLREFVAASEQSATQVSSAMSIPDRGGAGSTTDAVTTVTTVGYGDTITRALARAPARVISSAV